jgi:hypothetical protein
MAHRAALALVQQAQTIIDGQTESQLCNARFLVKKARRKRVDKMNEWPFVLYETPPIGQPSEFQKKYEKLRAGISTSW